ncbi:MAG: phosphoribosylamine--glycine ligase [Rhodospirillales bacterium]|nr:phosphoribosylamine--glycine ligase [Rhodospirillales bacterium]
MRFLGIGDSCDLGSLYRRLIQDGHEVKVHIGTPLCLGTLAGIVPQTADWRNELGWLSAAGQDGIILFENVAGGRGELQDALRAQGFNVIGGSAYGDRLENDRAYAQEVLASLGLNIAGIYAFSDPHAALDFLKGNPARYVLKFNGPGYASSDNYVGRLADGADVQAVLSGKADRLTADNSFILMDHIEGVEMGVGAYFDGSKFLTPACLDWEHKNFFPGGMGELTGEMGTVATYSRTRRFFELTLARMAPLLKANGYMGYININTVVNAQGIWPLEFTCRFGYPGFAVLEPLQATGWAALLGGMVRGDLEALDIRPGFSVGIVLTTPPFPYTREDVDEAAGLPVIFTGQAGPDDANIHYGEIGIANGRLVTSGKYGWTMVVTGTGPTIRAAQRNAYDLTARVFVPNLRYRCDIGDNLIARDFARVEALGLLDD